MFNSLAWSIKELILIIIFIFLMKAYFNIFLEYRKKRSLQLVYLIFIIWEIIKSKLDFITGFMNISITILVTIFIVSVAFKGKFWNKCIFVISFDAIWIFMETMCGFILSNYFENYLSLQGLGSALSIFMLFIIVTALERVFTNDEIRELPSNYSIVLILIPTGSIYIIYNLFILSEQNLKKGSSVNLIVASLILLIINILVFSIYLRLADDLQIKRCNLAYEQQLELCERHQQETELSMIQVRDAKHNMKNHLVTIRGYIEKGNYGKAVNFIDEIIEASGIVYTEMANTGNIVIDSLINYWADQAKRRGIAFQFEANIPIQMPFKGADISLVLGNALENAVEAAEKAIDKKYIHVGMKYNKENFIIFMGQSFFSWDCNHGIYWLVTPPLTGWKSNAVRLSPTAKNSRTILVFSVGSSSVALFFHPIKGKSLRDGWFIPLAQ